MSHLSETFIWALSLAGISCVLLRPRGIAEAWWACGAAVLLVATRLIPLSQAGAAVVKGIDVYLFLAGMMILSELAREKGVFEWIAELAARHAAGSPRRLFVLIYLAGTAVTAILSNDATAVVLTPAVLTIVRRLRIEPAPYLLTCAFIANAASFVLPISNPANLVVFAGHMPPLVRWLELFSLPSLVSIILTFCALRFLSRHQLAGEIRLTLPRTALSPEGRLAVGGLTVAALALITASARGWSLGAPTCGAALLATAVMTFRDRGISLAIARRVSWSVIPLVAGLFVIVAALQNAGMLGLARAGLAEVSRLGAMTGNLVTALTVGLLTNVMNNLPIGLVSGAAVSSTPAGSHLAGAVLIGVDLGPNLSVTGSLATILWLIALRRENIRITGWQFFQAGLVAMPLALLGSVLALGR